MLFIVRYGEIAIKSKPVRKRFEDRLVRNIKSSMGGAKFSIMRAPGRLFIEADDRAVKRALARVFGVVSFSLCEKTSSDMGSISKLALEAAKILKRGESFAVRARRVGKHAFTSKDIEEKVGEAVVKKLGAKVNLSKPDRTVWVEVRDKDAFVYTEVFDGPGGFPLGTQGRLIGLVGDVRGVVACWLTMKRGCEVVPVFFNLSKKLVEEYSGALGKWSAGSLKPHERGKLSAKDAYKAGSALAKDEKASGMVSAEPVGRVKDFRKLDKFAGVPVFRPLVGLDESAVKKLGKKIPVKV